jgi:hypothetical protein
MATTLDKLPVEKTADDRTYVGSRYSEVVSAIFANPYQRVWGAAGEPALPVHKVTFRSVASGMVAASERILDAAADLRWGPNRDGFRRLVHPNGVCLTGTWRIHERTPYSGYFTQGSVALIVGRYSTCCTETCRGNNRSLSLAGKLFPTVDINHAEPLHTANFVTQQDIGGEHTEFVNDAELRNAPDVTAFRRATGVPTLLVTGRAFDKVDQQPAVRQMYPVAELGKPVGTPTRAPQFMRLLVAPNQPKIPGAKLDFRDEIMAQIFDRGDPAPKRTLRFLIEVTDDGDVSGPAFRLKRTFSNWRQIGEIVFDNAVVSHNGDAVLHFNHPTWRNDRNDPLTATRVDGRKTI